VKSSAAGADILIVEDEAPMRRLLRAELSDLGYQVSDASGLREAYAELDRQPFDLVITDLALADGTGMDLLAKVQKVQPEVPVVILTGRGTIPDAVSAIKSGAFDFLPKPFDAARLAVVVENAVERGRQARELELARRDRARQVGAGLIGQSPSTRALRKLIAQVAASDTTVLIQGESGTGKELVARALHEGSRRKERPFVAVDCGALEGNLLASEMFGHVKGAFTGADTTRQGLFQAAHLGTLFLDEIGNLPMDLQARLLRVLQERRVRPIGGNAEREVDVRVIAATNRDVLRLAAEGSFRQDLYYRLAVVTVRTPPLRERMEDVALLAEHFARAAAARAGRSEVSIAPSVMARLMSYEWPGNVRELSNVVERGVIMAPDRLIRDVDLPEMQRAGPSEVEPLDQSLQRAEREALRRALERTGSKAEAARLLGISRRALYDKLARLGLAEPGAAEEESELPRG
jgi:two-component system response regulator PilR (NtrC family)